jgi:hypothetical protein
MNGYLLPERRKTSKVTFCIGTVLGNRIKRNELHDLLKVIPKLGGLLYSEKQSSQAANTGNFTAQAVKKFLPIKSL